MESLINKFANTFVFTAYLKSGGGLKQRAITWRRRGRKKVKNHWFTQTIHALAPPSCPRLHFGIQCSPLVRKSVQPCYQQLRSNTTQSFRLGFDCRSDVKFVVGGNILKNVIKIRTFAMLGKTPCALSL